MRRRRYEPFGQQKRAFGSRRVNRLAPGARCYLTTWNGVPVNFCATVPVITKKNHRRFTRIVTLPDFQGVGIGGRQVDNAEKILSLYEPDIHVLVRGKAGAEVEFGNTVLLGENQQGIILDYQIWS